MNAAYEGRFRLLQGIEANIDAAGHLDFTAEEAATFDVVLAAPHSRLRRNDDQTDAETALAHARLAAIPVDRIVNCWPLDRLLAWLSDPSFESGR